ncbi:MAG TPA: hypothetical protein QGF58_30785 [Myxococcota bacterium]|nr:hypothetical protein [Myxococcota bacterium]
MHIRIRSRNLDGLGQLGSLRGDVDALQEDYSKALSSLGLTDVDGLAVFRTQDPRAELGIVIEAASELTLELKEEFVLDEVFDDYCVYSGVTSMPVWQEGEPPFTSDGGGWVFEDGAPVLQGWEDASVIVTVPRESASLFPTVVFSRTGGGGDRPLVDRGPVTAAGAEPETPGAGPALHFARAGYAEVSIDGPHGGLRNVSGADEQFLMFNVLNPVAMRDNVRQSAVELAIAPLLVDELVIDSRDCPGASEESRLEARVLMGHSMGATIAPLAVVPGGYEAMVLSGAGGSWTENVVHKQSPIEVRPIAEAMLGVEDLDEFDPVLNLLQWAGESADPPVYGRDIVDAGVHVLMLQGIVDTYILPPIANATSLGLELDLGGDPLEEDLVYEPLGSLLSWSGAEHVELPFRGDPVTRVVVQHPEDGILDGHEVVFQSEAPKLQLEHFLETLAEGVPEVQ